MLFYCIFILLQRDCVRRVLLNDPRTFYCIDYFVIGGIRTCLGVSKNSMLRWFSSNFCPLNLLLVRSHQAEVIIVKPLIQERNNVTRVLIEPRSLDQHCRKNDVFTHSVMMFLCYDLYRNETKIRSFH